MPSTGTPSLRLLISSQPPRSWRLLAAGTMDRVLAEAEALLPASAGGRLLSVEVVADGIVSDATVVSGDLDGLAAALLALAA